VSAFTGEVHPVADLFPMLADDELAELAEDIKARGLLQPPVLDVEGRLLDGRNRLAACDLAGVEPTFITYDGDDPDGYALAVNVARRHLSKGQQAMVVARAASVFKKPLSSLASDHNMSKARVIYAKVVLDHARDLADSVVSGATSLNDAYKEANARKKAAEGNDSKMAELREKRPDLAVQVVEESLTLTAAYAAMQADETKRVKDQRDARALLTRIVDLAAPTAMSSGFLDSWAEQLGEPDDELGELMKRAEQAAQVLLDLTERARR